MKSFFFVLTASLTFASLTFAQTSLNKSYEKTLYVLSIGVNQNKYVQALKYAENDAKDIVREIKNREGKSTYPSVYVIDPLVGSKATTTNIKAILQTMAGNSGFCKNNKECTVQNEIDSLIDKIKTNYNSNRLRPEDGLLIFFSGHSYRKCKEKDENLRCKNENFGNELHLVVNDTEIKSENDDLNFKNSWRDSDFEENLVDVQAGRIAIVLDSCFSGASEATGDDWRLGPLNSSGFSQLIYEKGIFILASSQKNQTSREKTGIRNGIFTSALLNSLKASPNDPIDLAVLFEKSSNNLFGVGEQSTGGSSRRFCKADSSSEEDRSGQNNRPLNPPENIRTSEMKNHEGIETAINSSIELAKLYAVYRNVSSDPKIRLARFFTDKFFNTDAENINLCLADWTADVVAKKEFELKRCETVLCQNRLILDEIFGDKNLAPAQSLNLLQEPKFLFYKREQINPEDWKF